MGVFFPFFSPATSSTHLLSEPVEDGLGIAQPGLLQKDVDVVAHTVRRPDAQDPRRPQQLLVDDPAQHCLGLVAL